MEEILLSFFDGLNKNVIGTLVGLAAVGTLSMTLVEFLKPLIRPFFHRHQLFKLLRGLPKKRLARAIGGKNKLPQEFYLLEREQFIISLRSGLQTAMDFPQAYRGSIKQFLGKLSNQVIGAIELIEAKRPEYLQPDLNAQMDARTKIDRLIESRLRTFDKKMDVRWKLIIYSLSLLFSFLIILAAFLIANSGSSCQNSVGPDEVIQAIDSLGSQADAIRRKCFEKVDFGVALLYSVIGALFAPVARDLSQAISSTRTR